jgi:hypothetical protein
MLLGSLHAAPVVTLSAPMASPDLPHLESKLGVPLGDTLRALIEVAYAREPERPQEAFRPLSLLLDWIGPDATTPDALRVDEMTPRDVLPFASTGTDQHHMGFLMRDPSLATDARPVVFIAQDVPSAHVVAPNLRAFLGLVAYGGASWVRRDSLDSEWKKVRAALLAGGEAGHAAAALVKVPGVSLPASPARVTRMAPDCRFDDVPANPLGDNIPRDPYRALIAARMFLQNLEYEQVLAAAEVARGSGNAVPAQLLTLEALHGLGRRDAFRKALDEVLAQWSVPKGPSLLAPQWETLDLLADLGGCPIPGPVRTRIAARVS